MLDWFHRSVFISSSRKQLFDQKSYSSRHCRRLVSGRNWRIRETFFNFLLVIMAIWTRLNLHSVSLRFESFWRGKNARKFDTKVILSCILIKRRKNKKRRFVIYFYKHEQLWFVLRFRIDTAFNKYFSKNSIDIIHPESISVCNGLSLHSNVPVKYRL